VPFALVYAEKYRTEDRLKIQTVKKLNTTQEKQITQVTAKITNNGLTRSDTGCSMTVPIWQQWAS